MDDAHGDIGADTCQDWVCPSRPFPRCSAMGNITCDADEVLRPDRDLRRDAVFLLFIYV